MDLSKSSWISRIPRGKTLKKIFRTRSKSRLHFAQKIIKNGLRSSELGFVKEHRWVAGGPPFKILWPDPTFTRWLTFHLSGDSDMSLPFVCNWRLERWLHLPQINDRMTWHWDQAYNKTITTVYLSETICVPDVSSLGQSIEPKYGSAYFSSGRRPDFIVKF